VISYFQILSNLVLKGSDDGVSYSELLFFFGLGPSSGILENRKHNVSETDPESETLCFLVSRTPDDGQSPKTQ
jgi:hypothetical protein